MKLTGIHAIRQVLSQSHITPVEAVLYITRTHQNLKEFLYLINQGKKKQGRNKITVVYKTNVEFKKLGSKQQVLLVIHSDTKTSTNILSLKDWLTKNDNKENICILVLDHIQDVQNLGAIFRSAALFAVDCIISALKRSAPENEYANRAASGAMNIVPSCKVSNITNAVCLLKKHNIWTYTMHMQGKNINNYKIPKRVAFILGCEHSGVSVSVMQNCDDALSIPTKKLTHLDSLNVSVSAAIACYEYYKM